MPWAKRLSSLLWATSLGFCFGCQSSSRSLLKECIWLSSSITIMFPLSIMFDVASAVDSYLLLRTSRWGGGGLARTEDSSTQGCTGLTLQDLIARLQTEVWNIRMLVALVLMIYGHSGVTVYPPLGSSFFMPNTIHVSHTGLQNVPMCDFCFILLSLLLFCEALLWLLWSLADVPRSDLFRYSLF